jgi:hypothetical protein
MANSIQVTAEPNLYPVSICISDYNLDDVVTSVNGSKGDVVLTKSSVGLSNVDNTSDANKPISTSTLTALNLKSDLSYVNTQLNLKQNLLGFTPYNATNPSGYISGITQTMVNNALGYTPYDASNPSGYISGINSSLVINALGFTPYNSLNPNNYTSNLGTVTSVEPILLGTEGTDINTSITNSTSSPQIYLNIPSASSTSRGLLTSDDWSLFNSKAAALSGSTNYLARWTSGSNIGISLIYDNGTSIGINRTNPTKTLDINGTLNVEGVATIKSLASSVDKLVFVNTSGALDDITLGTGLSLNGGVLTATGTGTGSIGGTGTSGFIPKFTATSSIGNSNIQDSGTLITLGSNSYINGLLSINTSPITGRSMLVGGFITGAVTAYGYSLLATIQTDVTSNAFGYDSNLVTVNSTFTLANLRYFVARTTGYGASSTITNVTGFNAQSTIAQSNVTTVYGFQGSIALGANRWNLYMDGTADNYLAGNLGIGATNLGGANAVLRISKALTGGTSVRGVYLAASTQSDVTFSTTGFSTDLSTQAASFTLSEMTHYFAGTPGFGAGSIVGFQNGFYVSSALIGANNNYGFRGGIPSGTNRWNLYMDGTANNYLAGSLGIGATIVTGYGINLARNITGATTAYGIRSQGVVQSDVTTLVSNYGSLLQTAAASFTLNDYVHHRSMQGTIGSGSVVINQYGYFADSSMIGATNNFGFYGNIASGTNRWNLYMNGTANNYLAGSLGIGQTTPVASAKLQVDSTTQGVLFPRMTSTQKLAISSPATGLVVFDTTLGKLCVFSTTWQTITSL